MSADRELLEKAAKAAGMLVFEHDKPFPNGDGWFYCQHNGRPALHFRKDGAHPATYNVAPWSPLTDDGDALRLAVKLRIVVQHAPRYVVAISCDTRIAEHEDGASEAATRRAIVRAAAAIADQEGRQVSKQPEALELAASAHIAYRVGWQRRAQAELRRQHALLEQMAAALDYTVRRLQADIDDGSRPDQWSMEDIVRQASAALAAHREASK